jgi:hypothetical protein
VDSRDPFPAESDVGDGCHAPITNRESWEWS